jgi:hypothetical protein
MQALLGQDVSPKGGVTPKSNRKSSFGGEFSPAVFAESTHSLSPVKRQQSVGQSLGDRSGLQSRGLSSVMSIASSKKGNNNNDLQKVHEAN